MKLVYYLIGSPLGLDHVSIWSARPDSLQISWGFTILSEGTKPEMEKEKVAILKKLSCPIGSECMD